MDIWNQFSKLTSTIGQALKDSSKIFNNPVKLALSVILVDLARADTVFSNEEHYFIQARLCEYFSISKDQSYALIEKASKILDQGADQENFAQTLKENLSPSQREEVVQILRGLIVSDQEVNPLEKSLLQRYINLLGVG